MIASFQALTQNQASLKLARQTQKESGAELNAAKAEIDRLGRALELRRSSRRGSDGDVLDDQEFRLMQELKASKAAYKR